MFREDCLFIEGGSCSVRLSYDKAIDLSVTTDKEIQKSYVGSVGGAIGGAALFGTLGAMVGGRAKEKTSTVTEFYLVVTYNKDNELAYLSFHVPPEQNGFFMSQIADYHRNKFSGKIATKEL